MLTFYDLGICAPFLLYPDGNVLLVPHLQPQDFLESSPDTIKFSPCPLGDPDLALSRSNLIERKVQGHLYLDRSYHHCRC
ncbi:hypothetical protein TNCV_2767011 [Trichonephila clavipes]|nr:hypothetical protein TNCV_2767011 [Trichonephila clavipes]